MAHDPASSLKPCVRRRVNAATKVEAARSGDLAYETGTFEESFKDASGKPVRVTGKDVVVWKKQTNGQWKAIIDIFNTDQ